MIPATLCFIFQGDPYHQVLLGHKKRGFAQGKIDGFGGKLQDDESVVLAAARELNEETSLIVSLEDLRPVGLITFVFPNKPAWDQEVHIFTALSRQGEPVESEEMRPEWFSLADIPYERMWDDSKYWLPYILVGGQITAIFTYAEDNETVKSFTIQRL